MRWDHNIHYHRLLLKQIPPGAQKALDVGCGAGLFAMRVAEKVPQVLAIDRDAAMIRFARDVSSGDGVRFVEADIMEADLPRGSFDFVSCLSTLHHLSLRPALERLGSLLAPAGVLAVLGLYRPATPLDYAYVGITGALDLGVGLVRHRTQASVRRPGGVVAEWHHSLREIRREAASALPGSRVRRHMYDRYSLIFRRSEGVDHVQRRRRG